MAERPPEISILAPAPAPRARGIFGVIDRALPRSARASADDLRRGRVFLAIWALLTSAAWFFAWLTVSTSAGATLAANSWILIAGGVLAVVNLPLAHLLDNMEAPSWLVTLELVGVVIAAGFAGTGITDTSQRYLLLAPLVGAFLVGPRAGVLATGLALTGSVALWASKAVFGMQYPPPDDQTDLFEVLASVSVVAIAGAMAFVYERSRKSGMSFVANAVRELRGKNDELKDLARRIADARDRALDESDRKGEFFIRMRAFSEQQGHALEETRRATERLVETIRAIASSVETLAGSSHASDATIGGMADSAGRVSRTAQSLLSGVEDTHRALSALTRAVAEVQGRYEQLRSGADVTSAAMLEMEQSAARVEQRAVRTVQLSDAVIMDAERGQAAVRRTLSGVDDIRANARLAGDVIRALESRVTAISAINSVIDEIAVETGVLALNASIIAAQAGESGHGFAIVADHMRALAGRTAGSTRQISALIRAVQAEAKNAVGAIAQGEGAIAAGVTLSEEAALALEQIVATARLATDEVKSIEAATMAQAERAREVGGAMAEVTRLVAEAVRSTVEHGRSAGQIETTIAALRAVAPELEQRSRQQAEGARQARAAIARISEMATQLSAVQGDQRLASNQTLKAIEEIQRIQRGQDDALRSLND